MISPAQQRIIQIDVTTACPRACSNCTRFCGHHAKPYFMPLDKFKAAVDSLEGYTGIVGVIGGEPTLHPDFDAMTRYLAYRRPDPPPPYEAYQPIADFAEYRHRHLRDNRFQKALFTSLGPGYAKHYELIQQSYRYQGVNDHSAPGRHLALLMDRREIGVPDADWERLRNDCWVQTLWSSSITPKGAYFCEIAAMRAVLFNGPDGWPVEPGWWRRTPADFGSQLDLCEGCSACLPVPFCLTSDESDLCTPLQAERLRAIGSRKKLTIVKPTWKEIKDKPVNHDDEPYIDKPKDRARHTAHRRQILGVVTCVGYEDYLRLTLQRNMEQLSGCLVVTEPGGCAWVDQIPRAVVYETDAFKAGGAPFAKGRAMAEAMAFARETLGAEWALVHDADVLLPKSTAATIAAHWLNPGALYYAHRAGPRTVADITAAIEAFDAGDAERLESLIETACVIHGKPRPWVNPAESSPSGYFQLLNLRGSVLLDRAMPYPHASRTAEFDDMTLYRQWYGSGKCHPLPLTVMHLPHGAFRENWAGRCTPTIQSQSKV